MYIFFVSLNLFYPCISFFYSTFFTTVNDNRVWHMFCLFQSFIHQIQSTRSFFQFNGHLGNTSCVLSHFWCSFKPVPCSHSPPGQKVWQKNWLGKAFLWLFPFKETFFKIFRTWGAQLKTNYISIEKSSNPLKGNPSFEGEGIEGIGGSFNSLT